MDCADTAPPLCSSFFYFFFITDCTCDGHAERRHYGVTENLCTMLYTTMTLFFQSCLKWPEEWPSDSPNLSRYGLSITLLRLSHVFTMFLKENTPLYTLYISVCSSFYFQRCPLWLQWPQYYLLANIFCPYSANKVDISDYFSFFDAVLCNSQILHEEMTVHCFISDIVIKDPR